MCSVMDRIGGSKITYDLDECEDNLRELSINFRNYSKNKTDFINKEHRQMEKFSKSGEK